MAATTPTSMNGGDGEYSYNHNSKFQKQGLELSEVLINEGIAENLDLMELISPSSSPKIFRIADLGCSVGPNTFLAVQKIIKSVQHKYQSCSPSQTSLEFQVFFNDQISNDFNTLFKNLPSDRQYFVVAVPGPFHGQLFPKCSLHFIHSFYTLHWLSNAPKELVDEGSAAYNKGRIYYTNSQKEVYEAYSAQFSKDTTSFLNVRAQELVRGGLMALFLVCVPDGIPPSQCIFVAVHALIEASLIDMANEGLTSKDKLDSFNLPIFSPTQQKLKVLIEENACFSIEKMEPIVQKSVEINSDLQMNMLHYRAAWEGIISEHFGNQIIDELFDRLRRKVVASCIYTEFTIYEPTVQLFVLLRRN